MTETPDEAAERAERDFLAHDLKGALGELARLQQSMRQVADDLERGHIGSKTAAQTLRAAAFLQTETLH